MTTRQFEYRLTVCPELSLGIFSQPTLTEVEGGNKEKRRLIGHIIATRSPAPCVTDGSMEIPKDWKTSKPPAKSDIGHSQSGATICIHSLAIKPEYQSMGVGSVLLKSYIQRIKDAKIADKLALLAHDDMKKFYSRFGFDDMGSSQCSFGGGNWSNMVSRHR